MSKLGFRRRRGFTLVEVTLALAAGSMLMLAMIYTAQQIETVTDEIYNEVLVQTLARDLNVNLDARVPRALAEAASAGDNIGMSVDNPTVTVYLPQDDEWLAANSLGALATGYAGGSFMIASNPHWTPSPTPTAAPTATPSPTPTPTPSPTMTPAPTPTASPTSTPTPAPTASATAGPTPTPAPAQGGISAPAIESLPSSMLPGSAPSYTTSGTSQNQTMTFGTFTLRFLDNTTSGRDDGELEYSTASGGWAPMLELNSRGMLALARFGFANWVPPSDSSTAALRFTMNAATAQNLVLIQTTLSKGSMLPFYLQNYYAPRSPNWTWSQNQVFNAPSAPSNWPQTTTAKDFRNQQGLFPVGVEKSLMTGEGFGAGDQIDVLNGAGAGSFGWVTFPNVDNNPTLDSELTDPSSTTFVDAQSGYSGYLTPGHWVGTETGLHGSTGTTAINNMASTQELVDTMIYDTDNGQTGSNRQFHVTGFAQWIVTNVQGTPAPGVTTQSGSAYLQFVGYCDSFGNPMPPGYTPW